MNGSLRTTTIICLLAFFGALFLPVSSQADVRNDKKEVERAVKKLSGEIDEKKKESGYLNSQVTKLEKELGDLTSQYHTTEKKILDAQKRLGKANIERTELNDELKQQQGALAQQLQAMHTAGEQSHLRLLLMQDNPADISRNIEYFNILNRHRTKKIQQLNKTSKKLEAVTELAAKERTKLRGLNEKLSIQKATVEKKLATREHALKQVRQDLSGKEKRLNKLKNQEAALQQKINRITQAANKKREDAAAKVAKAAEAKRAAEQRRQQAQRPVQQAARTQPQPTPAKKAVAKAPKATGKQVTTTRTANKAFSKMRGKLSWPVSGRVIHQYASRRNEKQRWKGIVITAPGGAKVNAIAPGKVAFAGWMEGYGHLIIIEHDRNYMSLYGYNRAVFKRAGQTVRANETIAAVGNSSGQSQNGLYFEIRHKTVPQNPARWLQ
ncbi:MAG: Peptidase M23 [uncultured Thiotrichaceae bacterium]|uniref:Peptidase M23 n=1 Tax=uncultured Thiotrichaceae bacterium TaxID=298394 RepID=A0A6S6TND7_9GAMM|nr:MAG: Peptidase M23 [uncultured Thiotrichaceae bacterium]